MEIKENVVLAPFTTFKIGGRARYFTEVKNREELKEAINYARGNSLPLFILGGGSNILVSDGGFNGLVIKMSSRGIIHEEAGDEVIITASAGESWDGFVEYAVEHGWHGVENLSGIPGTVGASPVQNIGAYGVEVKSVIESVLVYDTEYGEERNLSAEECRFAYRDSFFKSPLGKKDVILSVTFRLKKASPLSLSYRDVAEYFQKENIPQKNITLKDMRLAILSVRAGKFPSFETHGTAGCYFKNPIVEEAKGRELSGSFPGMPVYPSFVPGTVKIPAAYIIDKICGLKGFSVGKARSYENYALALVAEHGASSEEVRSLAEVITAKVLAETGIKLFPEVELVGNFNN